MCCGSTEILELPASAIEALASYRRLLAERPWDWGDERIDFFRWARYERAEELIRAFLATGDWTKAARTAIGATPPGGMIVVGIGVDGTLEVSSGPTRPVLAGRRFNVDVIVESHADVDCEVTLAGRTVPVRAGGAAYEMLEIDGGRPSVDIALGKDHVTVDDVFKTTEAAELRLSSPRCARWSVTDTAGGAWFPKGVLPKYDYHHRPFFHTHEASLSVPAGELTIICTRGIEYEREERAVSTNAGAIVTVECDPERLYDPAAAGWYGGDMHVHMNYSGDLVCTPSDAARMQLGEGLHLLNLVAGNCLTSLVYDLEMFEATVGEDLPWSTDTVVARMGVEYRNDLLGHVHALGLTAKPTRYYTGHLRSDHPEDWPPNKVACDEMHALGATVGYCHPSQRAFPDDWSTDAFFAMIGSPDAREMVADAALGAVDSIDLISPTNDEGAVFLYHRLLSCGLRLAATAGTDTFLSFSHSSTFSNPPGWGRVYADVGDEPLSVDAFKRAIRNGRTIVTNGPWLTFDVDGAGPGSVLDLAVGDKVRVRAKVQGPGAEELTIQGADGVLAQGDPSSGIDVEILVEGPMWIAAVARGNGHPNTLDVAVLAHTSPVYIAVDGTPVARKADAQWCLGFLDSFEQCVARNGRFDPATRDEHFGDLVAVLDEAREYYRSVGSRATR